MDWNGILRITTQIKEGKGGRFYIALKENGEIVKGKCALRSGLESRTEKGNYCLNTGIVT